MIEHIVLFRGKPGITTQTRDSIVAFARTMKAEIPEILYISAGVNWSDRGDGYEFALVSRFADRDALDVYQVHPYHERFKAEFIKPNVEKILAIDYFIE